MTELTPNPNTTPKTVIPERGIKGMARRLAEKLKGRGRDVSDSRDVLEGLAEPEIPIITAVDLTPPAPPTVSETSTLSLKDQVDSKLDTTTERVLELPDMSDQEVLDRLESLRNRENINLQAIWRTKQELSTRGIEDTGLPSRRELAWDIDEAKRNFTMQKQLTDEYREAERILDKESQEAQRRGFSGNNDSYNKALNARNATLEETPANPSPEYLAAKKALEDARKRGRELGPLAEEREKRNMAKRLVEKANNGNLSDRERNRLEEKTDVKKEDELKDTTDEALLNRIQELRQDIDSEPEKQDIKSGTGDFISSKTSRLIRSEEEARRRGLDIVNIPTSIPETTPSPAPLNFESKDAPPKAPPTGLEDVDTEELARRAANLDKSGLDQYTINILKKEIMREISKRGVKKD